MPTGWWWKVDDFAENHFDALSTVGSNNWRHFIPLWKLLLSFASNRQSESFSSFRSIIESSTLKVHTMGLISIEQRWTRESKRASSTVWTVKESSRIVKDCLTWRKLECWVVVNFDYGLYLKHSINAHGPIILFYWSMSRKFQNPRAELLVLLQQDAVRFASS